MEQLLGAIVECIIELYVDLVTEFVPEKKFKKWQTTLLKVSCALIGLGSIALIVGGIVLISEKINTTAGIAMLSVGAAIVLAHIIAFLVVGVKEQKRLNEENKEDKGNKEDSDDR